jgi:hypothetical protein
MHPSSALRLACSQARLANSTSTVPPYRSSGPWLEAVSHVFTTKLVADSSWNAVEDVYAEWTALRQLVVDICCETFICIVLVRGWVEAVEYCDMRFAIFQ